MTQVEVARSLDITAEYLSKLENNSKRPSLVLLTKLSELLDIPLQLLIFSSLEAEDLPKSDRSRFKKTKPILVDLIQKLVSDDYDDFDEITSLLEELKSIRQVSKPRRKVS